MGRLILILAFVFAFITTVIVNLPARLVMERALPSGTALSYDRVSGSVWNVRLTGVNVAGQPLGRVQLKMRPAAIVTGRVAYDFDVAAPAGRFVGDVSAGLDRSVSVRLPRARVNVQELDRLQEVLRRAPSEVRLENIVIEMQGDGACRTARGRISSDILKANGPRFGWDGTDMDGSLTCSSGVLEIALSSVEQTDPITASVRFDAREGLYDLNARVETDNGTLVQGVQQLGFRADNGSWIYTRSNRPSPTPESSASVQEGSR